MAEALDNNLFASEMMRDLNDIDIDGLSTRGDGLLRSLSFHPEVRIMARVAKANTITKSKPPGRKPGRPGGAVGKLAVSVQVANTSTKWGSGSSGAENAFQIDCATVLHKGLDPENGVVLKS